MKGRNLHRFCSAINLSSFIIASSSSTQLHAGKLSRIYVQFQLWNSHGLGYEAIINDCMFVQINSTAVALKDDETYSFEHKVYTRYEQRPRLDTHRSNIVACEGERQRQFVSIKLREIYADDDSRKKCLIAFIHKFICL